MSDVDVVDATWLDVPASALAPLLADRDNWRRWWPGLDLQAVELRGRKGVRWRVRSAHGATGSMEVWLQPDHDGTVAHYFLRLDGTRRPLRPRTQARLARAYRVRTKRVFWAIADQLDPGRLARVAGPPTTIP